MELKLTPGRLPVTQPKGERSTHRTEVPAGANSEKYTPGQAQTPQGSTLDLGKLTNILMLRNAPPGVSGVSGLSSLTAPFNDARLMAEMLASPKLSPFNQTGTLPSKVDQLKAIQHLAAGLGNGFPANIGSSSLHYAVASAAVNGAIRKMEESRAITGTAGCIADEPGQPRPGRNPDAFRGLGETADDIGLIARNGGYPPSHKYQDLTGTSTADTPWSGVRPECETVVPMYLSPAGKTSSV